MFLCPVLVLSILRLRTVSTIKFKCLITELKLESKICSKGSFPPFASFSVSEILLNF